MKKTIALTLAILALTTFAFRTEMTAQNKTKKSVADSTTFKGYLHNKEYNVYLRINFYSNNVSVPGQEIFGPVPGFFGDKQDGRKWLITDAKITSPRHAELSIINDYGSEDLTATLTQTNDSTYELTQKEGSDLKIARNRKWQKMPKTLSFVRQ